MKIPGYDNQAGAYDERVGTGEDIARCVAEGVAKLAHDGKLSNVLDVGCGTGEIGQYLNQLAINYTAMDRSAGMLDAFKSRLGDKAKATKLIETDGNLPWPVDDHSIDVIFSSRALHLLDLSHVLNEIQRLTSDSGLTCVIGRITRDKKGVSQTMRRQMRKILEVHGFKGRSGKRNLEDISDHCLSAGATDLGLVTVTRWKNTESPLHSIDNWRSKTGLAGIAVSDEIRMAVLDELEQWAIQHYGSLNLMKECPSFYELRGFYFPPRS